MSRWASRAGSLLDAEQFSRYLRQSHLGKPYQDYIRTTFLATLVTAAGLAISSAVLVQTGLMEQLIPVFPPTLAAVVLPVAGTAIAFSCLYFYPALLAHGRRNRINEELPFAVTYMQALSSTMTLYQVFRSVFEEEELYGEISREFGMLVRDVELFGDDLLTAMRSLYRSTPSAQLGKLVNELILIFESGGSIPQFLATQSANYREQSQREMKLSLQTIEIMAEVYVTAFIAGPITLIIMVVAQNMTGQNQLSGYMPLIYLGLPVGSILMIWILYILLPSEKMEVSRKEISDLEFTSESVGMTDTSDLPPAFMKRIENKKQQIRIRDILAHPMRYFITDYQFAAGIGLATDLIIGLLFLNGTIAGFFPQYTVEVAICLLVIAGIAPLAVAYEARKWYINRIEAQIPEFLRELAELKDIGMTLQGAIETISRSKLGVLVSELQIVAREMKMGSSVMSALVRMEERIGVVPVKRAISLIIKASEITDYIRDILIIASTDLEHYISMKKDRFNVSFVYVMIVYLSFCIFLYTAYELNVAFIAQFKSQNLNVNTQGNVLEMFRIAIMLGGFSGIMAGQLSAANILAGLKHTIIFLTISVILFVYIIP